MINEIPLFTSLCICNSDAGVATELVLGHLLLEMLLGVLEKVDQRVFLRLDITREACLVALRLASEGEARVIMIAMVSCYRVTGSC
jgi:hypothetical protein